MTKRRVTRSIIAALLAMSMLGGCKGVGRRIKRDAKSELLFQSLSN